MANVRLDIVDTSSIVLTGNAQQEYVRGFQIDTMDTSVDPSALAGSAITLLAGAGVNMGQPHPQNSAALLSRIEVQGLLPDAVQGRLRYSTLQGATPTSYVLTRSTRLVQETTNVLPDGQIITAKYTGTPQQSIPLDYITMNFLRPCTVLTAEGLRYGPPNYPGADYVGYVNDAPWGGRPKGHWLVADFTTQWSKYDGYHTFRCSVQAFQNGKDWSQTGILKSQLTGKYVNYPGMQSDIQTALAATYTFSNDIGGNANGDGFVRVGGYPVVSFPSIGL